MAIPGPGTAISMTTIATEFGGTVPHSLSEYYRGGGLVPNSANNAAIPTSGQIAMGNFYGSANRPAINLTIASNSYNYDVYTNRGPAYVAGFSDITVTVNPGVTVGSTTTPTYAMLVPSAFNPGDTVTIVNNGVIQGMGGTGGNGGTGSPAVPANTGGTPGATGGSAIYVNRPTVITNNGVVASGGGGGGGGGSRRTSTPTGPKTPPSVTSFGGGGGGGGAGFNGGVGGTGGPGANGAGTPGSTGTSPAGGAGGPSSAGAGGAGGGRGAAGTAGTPSSTGAGTGGATGNYIVGNPFVTWPVAGTRQGNVA